MGLETRKGGVDRDDGLVEVQGQLGQHSLRGLKGEFRGSMLPSMQCNGLYVQRTTPEELGCCLVGLENPDRGVGVCAQEPVEGTTGVSGVPQGEPGQ